MTSVTLLLLLITALWLNVNSLSSPTNAQPKRQRIPVLQYHNSWVCVDKPCGLTVHRSKGTPKHVKVLTTSVKRQLARKVFPVHRLDHRTSGAMLLAFDSETAGKLHDAAIRKGHKQYLALVRGEWNREESSVLVDKPLRVKGTIKDAMTKFTLLATTKGREDDRCSLLLCEPLTGRTHQIRRHAFDIGHPIIGDSQHGSSRCNRYWRENKEWNRLALHCWKLDFEFDGEQRECIAPISFQLKKILNEMELWDEIIAIEPRLSMEPFDIKGGTHGRHFRKRRDEEDSDEI
ncbi:unnamed protein product [Cylindrotheca closterium]|uniref:Pseudouridine synthase RsuA/RluA-like domain-containing protein n=1 Tax=Cylindrotheca closterium TaxID=2856 RepID=A0AAD2CAK3_9STRA|nr:unnamed protein product [Cylindrotheca closterium]